MRQDMFLSSFLSLQLVEHFQRATAESSAESKLIAFMCSYKL